MYFLLSVQTCICAVLSLFFLWRTSAEVSWEIIYYPCVVIFLCCLSFYGWKKQSKAPQVLVEWPLKFWEWIPFLLLLGYGAFLRFSAIHRYSIWLDEDQQSQIALGNFKNIIYGASAVQAQPPLDYFFTALGQSIFGISELGLRIFPVFFSTLSIPIFYSLCRHLTTNIFLSIGITFCFVTNDWLILYATQARPISIGIYFELFFLLATYNFFVQKEKFSWVGASAVFISALLFLFSLGFQPPIVLLSIFLCLLCGVFLWNQVLQRKIIIYLGSIFSAFLLYLPLFVFFISENQRYIRNTFKLELLLEIFRGMDWLRLYEQFVAIISPDYHYFMVFIPLSIATIIFPQKVERLKKTQLFFFLFSFLSLLLPLIMRLLFKSTVVSTMYARYYLTYAPILLIVIILIINFYIELLPRKIKYISSFIVAIGFLYHGHYSHVHTNYIDNDWRGLYKLLSESGNSNDKAYMLNLNKKENWGEPTLIASSVYYKSNNNRVQFIPFENLKNETLADLVMEDYVLNPPTRNIFFIQNLKPEAAFTRINPILFSSQKGIVFHQVGNMQIIQVSVEKDLRKTLTSFFRDLEKILPRRDENYIIDEILRRIALVEKRQELKFK